VTTEPLSVRPESEKSGSGDALIAGGRGRSPLTLWLAVAIVLIAAAAAIHLYSQLAAVKRESARRFAELQQIATAASDAAARADAEAQAARRQAILLENRLAEEIGQREGLEQLYADLSRGRDEVILVEVERLIILAAQELQIGGNIATALAALQTADARLARADTARFVPLRRVLAGDIERLKAAPTVDTTGIALKLDQLIASVDQWPLLAEGAAPPVAPPVREETAPSRSEHWWDRALAALRRELQEHSDLIRIHRVDTPEALLLTAPQQQLVRQQIRLRLLSARQALLARNDRLYRSDLAQAQALIAHYVDTGTPQTSAAVALVKQLASARLSVDVPQIGESLTAVRAVRTAPNR
jgi:uroporphyrin-III C-methyltransferase